MHTRELPDATNGLLLNIQASVQAYSGRFKIDIYFYGSKLNVSLTDLGTACVFSVLEEMVQRSSPLKT